ncbi:MAG: hypothetical protein QOD48_883 [Gaiellaceae bacterium]|jgi:hypothetical protein|nr:hypothetical protein [Gaiellaceae bacterium]
MPAAIAGAKIDISMKKPTPLFPHHSMEERGREAPMVISPLRLARLLVGIARHAKADAHRRPRHD